MTSKESRPNDNFYTTEELMNFTNQFTDRSIVNISKFIETKTNSEYCVVKRELLTDLTKQFQVNNSGILDVKMFAMDIWEKVNLQNHNTINKWKKELQELNCFVEESTNSGVEA